MSRINNNEKVYLLIKVIDHQSWTKIVIERSKEVYNTEYKILEWMAQKEMSIIN